MRYRRLGNSGVQVSVIGLGTNRFGSSSVPQESVNSIVDAALDAGINLIDTANIYSQGASEESLGIALEGRWDKVVLATKFWFPTGDGINDKGASRYHILNAVEGSLRRLRTDHIDLYYIHRWDEETPIEETLRTLDDLIGRGKVRYLGASNFSSWQLAHSNLLATFRGWTSFVALQSEYHMLQRDVERDVLPYCRIHDVGFIPYYPLAGGFLTGKYSGDRVLPHGSRASMPMKEKSDSVKRMIKHVRGFLTDEAFGRLDDLANWAQKQGMSMSNLALAWLIAQEGVVSVIPGATKPDHVVLNSKASDIELSDTQLQEIEQILGTTRLPGRIHRADEVSTY